MKLHLIDKAFGHTPSGGICHFYKGKIDWDRTRSEDGLTIATDHSIAENYDYADIALLLEPRELIPGVYEFVENNPNGYKILTHDKEMLKLPNAIAYEFGGCWIEPNDVGMHSKSKNVSIISSKKKVTTGHKLRQAAIGRLGEYIDVYGRGHNEIEKKVDGLRDYRFSIVIENVNSDYFFTEKLIDCFATGTIPIYWGMPSIGKFFNKNGMITFNTIGELHRKLTIIKDNAEQEYNYRIEAVKDNFSRCQQYFATEDSIYKALTGKGLM